MSELRELIEEVKKLREAVENNKPPLQVVGVPYPVYQPYPVYHYGYPHHYYQNYPYYGASCGGGTGIGASSGGGFIGNFVDQQSGRVS